MSYSGLKFRDANGKMVSVSEANPLPTAGGGGGSGSGGGDGLTNAQLRASPVATTVKMASGGNRRVNVTTSATALGSQACSQVTIINRMDGDMIATVGGAELDIMARSYFTFFGITNLSEISLHATAAGNISLRWEA